MPLLTQGVAYDVVVVADEAGEFGDYVQYHTWDPRPTAGTQGLAAGSWHPMAEDHGGVQLNNRFKKMQGRPPAFGAQHCFLGIMRRKALRFVQQRGRFLSAPVRPLVWLFIFAAGFRSVLGVSIISPYETYVLYGVSITPGLAAMILPFAGMQSSLSMVYDREVGSVRVLLTSPYPRWNLLTSKLVAGASIAVVQVYAYRAVAWWWQVESPPIGYLVALLAIFLAALMLGSIGLFVSSLIKQIENFASVMTFIIFPVFFTSSALPKLESELMGQNRVFEECNAALQYVCESPTLLEQRAFEIARIIAEKL